ncbi:TetR/AcrR family transcriptional regulator [Lampropedia puyangensis]|uniref:TetR/AcrR family transcriptional regulator n=1 Tax=Lampropedia puyangensis TaxID=1330072 RepID=A0A4S8F068_9BURK|nr:TetR/AcrR family transcriptional regulator [Lampropedia puyangensis]THT98481.1 TetR/AcrR family transcriptional regulator [Lampropedia puyangensis]
MSSSPTKPSPLGRTRDAHLDGAIRQAVIEIFAESGAAGVTMDAVAQRVGAGKASLYRRWNSKDELLIDALTAANDARNHQEIDTGNLRDDLIGLFSQLYSVDDPVLQAVHQEIMRDLRSSLSYMEKVAPERLLKRRQRIHAVFARAQHRGEIASNADVDLIQDLLPAMILHRYSTKGLMITDALITRYVDTLVMPLLRPTHGQ